MFPRPVPWAKIGSAVKVFTDDVDMLDCVSPRLGLSVLDIGVISRLAVCSSTVTKRCACA